MAEREARESARVRFGIYLPNVGWEGLPTQVLQERLPRYYAFPYDAARLTLYGPPSHCAEQAQTLLRAGVRTLIFSLVTNDLSQLKRVAHEVLPELRRTNSSSIP